MLAELPESVQKTNANSKNFGINLIRYLYLRLLKNEIK